MNNPIKWSGSKRTLAKQIIEKFPTESNYLINKTYYEPFCGACNVLLELLSNPLHKDKRVYDNYICSDISDDLIILWNKIKHEPQYIIKDYDTHWRTFNTNINEDRSIEQHRKDYFNYCKNKFNKIKGDDSESAALFLFLLRTAYNGLYRLNKKGEYNTSCHFSRPGINPTDLAIIIENTSIILNKYNVQFEVKSYDEIIYTENDFAFLDPPYESVGHGNGKTQMYGNGVDKTKMCDFINNNIPNYILTYNANRGGKEGNKIELENTMMFNLEKQDSSYTRLLKKNNVRVSDIMYVKY